MMHEPNSETPPAPVNPYAAPQAEETVAPDTDVVFRVRPQVAWSSGLLFFLFAAYESIVYTNWEVNWTTIAYVFVLRAGLSILAGLGGGILIDALLQKKFSQLMPGHWFLLFLSFSNIAMWAADFWAESPDVQLATVSISRWQLVQTIVLFGLLLLFFLPTALTSTEPLRWLILAWGGVACSVAALLRVPAAYMAESDVSDLISNFLWGGDVFGGIAIVVCFYTLVIMELAANRPRTRRRDIYHWLGAFGPATITMAKGIIILFGL